MDDCWNGILHEEFHFSSFSQNGGELQMVQLWVNLPKKDKMTPSRYQSITKEDIPNVDLPNNAGTLRPIAGAFDMHQGPAKTFTPLQVWDIQLNTGGKSQFELPDGRLDHNGRYSSGPSECEWLRDC